MWPGQMDLLKDKTVMLVDDNSVDNYITSRVIQQAGYFAQVTEMETGDKALDFLRQHASMPDMLPDLIFLDINMPLVNGFEFLQEFQKFSSHVKAKCKIIVLTSSDKIEDIHQLINNHLIRKYLIKPLSANDLAELPHLF